MGNSFANEHDDWEDFKNEELASDESRERRVPFDFSRGIGGAETVKQKSAEVEQITIPGIEMPVEIEEEPTAAQERYGSDAWKQFDSERVPRVKESDHTALEDMTPEELREMGLDPTGAPIEEDGYDFYEHAQPGDEHRFHTLKSPSAVDKVMEKSEEIPDKLPDDTEIPFN